MALLQEETTIPAKRMLLIGIPALILAVAISLASHRWAHRYGDTTFCGGAHSTTMAHSPWSLDGDLPDGICPASGVAGAAWTFGLAVVSFALLVRFPRSLFLMSMAFVNASARIPDSVTVFLQYLINNRTSLRVDESVALTVLGPVDPAIPTVIMCFYSLLLLFFSIIIVHNARAVRFKWPVAFGLFLVMALLGRGAPWGLPPFSGV